MNDYLFCFDCTDLFENKLTGNDGMLRCNLIDYVRDHYSLFLGHLISFSDDLDIFFTSGDFGEPVINALFSLGSYNSIEIDFFVDISSEILRSHLQLLSHEFFLTSVQSGGINFGS